MRSVLGTIRRLAKAALAALFIAATPALTAVEAIAHARSADQPHHPNRAHFEDLRVRAHSDHCLAGRTFGTDRLVLPADAPYTAFPIHQTVARTGSTGPASGQPTSTHHSRAPPAVRV